MGKMLTTRSRAVSDIVVARQKAIENELAKRIKKETVDETWRELRKKGGAYSRRGWARMTLDYEDGGKMIHNHLPDGAWKDQRCFIIGGGASLKDFNFSRLNGELVIGVNRAFEKLDCTINFSMDDNLYRWIKGGELGKEARERFEEFKGLPVWLDSAGIEYPEGIYMLNKAEGRPDKFSMTGGICSGTNSGFGALCLAICLGANPIYLLGFDMYGENGKQAWWHDGYPKHQSDKVYPAFINDFERIAVELTKKKIRVVNLNLKSKLKCFEFGELKDIKSVDRPIFASYYTEETGYEEQVEKLKASLKRFNLEYDIKGITDKGNWYRNTYYKSKFVVQTLKRHPNRSVVFVDADAIVRMNPILFNDLDCDFAFHNYNNKELLGGTLYFGNTKGARYMARKWLDYDNEFKKTLMPQKNLQAVFNKYKDDVKWKALPIEYCMIFDCRARQHTRPVIEHMQLSRQHKDPHLRKANYMLKRSLAEVKAFCKGKRMCIVGNASSVLHKRKTLDTFEVIGRMNRGRPAGKEDCIGSRTDILFLSTGMSRKSIEDGFHPKFVLWMTANHKLAHDWVLKNATQNPKKDWYELYRKLGINPTTGMMTLNFCLKHLDFKSLAIYGFDFFSTPTWYNTKIDSGQKHSGKKEKVLFMKMIKGRKNVRMVQ